MTNDYCNLELKSARVSCQPIKNWSLLFNGALKYLVRIQVGTCTDCMLRHTDKTDFVTPLGPLEYRVRTLVGTRAAAHSDTNETRLPSTTHTRYTHYSTHAWSPHGKKTCDTLVRPDRNRTQAGWLHDGRHSHHAIIVCSHQGLICVPMIMIIHFSQIFTWQSLLCIAEIYLFRLDHTTNCWVFQFMVSLLAEPLADADFKH